MGGGVEEGSERCTYSRVHDESEGAPFLCGHGEIRQDGI